MLGYKNGSIDLQAAIKALEDQKDILKVHRGFGSGLWETSSLKILNKALKEITAITEIKEISEDTPGPQSTPSP